MSATPQKQSKMLFAVVASFVLWLLAVSHFLSQDTVYNNTELPNADNVIFETQSFINADQLELDEVDAYIVFENAASQEIIDQVLAEIMQDALIAPSSYYQPYKKLEKTKKQDRSKVYVLTDVNLSMLARKYLRNAYVKYVEAKDIFLLQQTNSNEFITNISFQEQGIIQWEHLRRHVSDFNNNMPLPERRDSRLDIWVVVVDFDRRIGEKSDINITIDTVDDQSGLWLSTDDFEVERIGLGDTPSLHQYNDIDTAGFQIMIKDDPNAMARM